MVLTQENKSFKLQMKFWFTVQDPLHASCLERLGKSEAQTCSILKRFYSKTTNQSIHLCTKHTNTFISWTGSMWLFSYRWPLHCIVLVSYFRKNTHLSSSGQTGKTRPSATASLHCRRVLACPSLSTQFLVLSAMSRMKGLKQQPMSATHFKFRNSLESVARMACLSCLFHIWKHTRIKYVWLPGVRVVTFSNMKNRQECTSEQMHGEIYCLENKKEKHIAACKFTTKPPSFYCVFPRQSLPWYNKNNNNNKSIYTALNHVQQDYLKCTLHRHTPS